MKLKVKAVLNFSYMNNNYVLYMKSQRCSTNYLVYDINIQFARYILINDHNEWSFIADLQPCEKLKTIIIKTVKEHDTLNLRKRSS